ncbi:hypothetical protein Q5H91_13580 [Sphingomonas sp. KR1UV-12]|uniref:Uncharacterized protein n=1 Tax=Sphingomonas aurea TaxID=3063994 RepID=A0ABT9EN35_9SPHN|nr:hypothetical protein [Sphingomonas sp. KR1UV-12]MDP1028250.1 hypothetical protein [Sphingomonas sp. KR1UV-12]
MREFLLAIWFTWQAVTSSFFPDPALKVNEARQWLNERLRVGDRLDRQLLRDMEAAGFKTGRTSSEMKRDILRARPWRDLPLVHVYSCEKTISARPAVTITDVRALIALDARNTIIHRDIIVLRTSL